MGLNSNELIERMSTSDSVLKNDDTISYEVCLQKVYDFISDDATKNSDYLATLGPVELRDYTRSFISKVITQKKYRVDGYIKDDRAEYQRLIRQLREDITDFGVLTPALDDDTISEIQVNDYKSIYVERKGKTELYTDPLTGKVVTFKTPEDCSKVINKLLRHSNVTLSKTQALQGASTADNNRVAAVHESVAALDKGENAHSKKSAMAVIRKHGNDDFSLKDLINFGSLPVEAANILSIIPKSGMTSVIAGATGSGKTVLLQSMVNNRPLTKRTFIVEDQSELSPHVRNSEGIDLSNTVQLEATQSEDAKPPMTFPTFENLIIQSLRMSPRLFILGEIRTPPTINQAMIAANTGHPFYSTIHAEDDEDIISRIASAVSSEVPSLPYDTILDMICKNIVFLIVQQKLDDGSRKMLQLTEVVGTEIIEGRTRPKLNRLIEFEGDGNGISEDGKIVGDFWHVNCISEKLKKKLYLKALTKEELDIITSGPKPGEERIKCTFDVSKLYAT